MACHWRLRSSASAISPPSTCAASTCQMRWNERNLMCPASVPAWPNNPCRHYCASWSVAKKAVVRALLNHDCSGFPNKSAASVGLIRWGSNWQPTACIVYDIANYATAPPLLSGRRLLRRAGPPGRGAVRARRPAQLLDAVRHDGHLPAPRRQRPQHRRTPRRRPARAAELGSPYTT